LAELVFYFIKHPFDFSFGISNRLDPHSRVYFVFLQSMTFVTAQIKEKIIYVLFLLSRGKTVVSLIKSEREVAENNL